MIDSTKPIEDATPQNDISGLKLPSSKVYTMDDIYFEEAKNIASATLKYLSAPPSKKVAPFDYNWFLDSHEEMFGEVWEWAGKLRHIELSIGIKAYLIPMELKNLVDDLNYWHKYKTYDTVEISARLHHRAVQIHPFNNGNGRWSRMLANIYLRQNNHMPVLWQEDKLAKENPNRLEYIKALKLADNGDYSMLVLMHEVRY